MKFINESEVLALIGTTWERDGLRRRIDRIEGIRKSYQSGKMLGNVFWGRPGHPTRKQCQWLPYFREWLSKATRVE
jgi:hypothetical protein